MSGKTFHLTSFHSDWVCAHTNKPLADIDESDFSNLMNWTAFDMISKRFGSESKAMSAIETDDLISKAEYSKLEERPFELMSQYGHITPPLDFSPSEELKAFFPNVKDWSNVTIEFNPEIDHFDLDGNFVKGIPND
jgi:hypothetical protein